MSELRLLPGALTVWAVTLILLTTGRPLLAVLMILGVAGTALAFTQQGQALVTTALGAAALVFTHLRQLRAAAHEFPGTIHGTLSADPAPTATGSWLLEVSVPAYPAGLSVFAEELPEPLAAGSQVLLDATIRDSDRPGVSTVLADAAVVAHQPPQGLQAVAEHVRSRLSETVIDHLDGGHRGLIPGMVLGDTSLQSPADTQLYIDTGLSHLSAVSGANVAVVMTAALLVCRALGAGPRIQTAAAAVALGAFVVLVGTEPSVLRAAVTGLVGLAAVLNSAQMEPLHALSLAVIFLVLWDPDLAVSYGFALSVAATAGIVVLTPVLTRPLVAIRLPLLLARAVAVAVAADVVTMPIISLMAGEVSVVGVLANIASAPASAPVTVLGLVATALALIPGPWGGLALYVVEPFVWWIHHVALWCANLPLVTVPAHPAWVLLIYGWIIAAILAGKVWIVVALGLTGLIFSARAEFPASDPVPLEQLHVHVIDDEEQWKTAPAGTQVIVVTDPEGRPAEHPTITPEGIPVLFPHRDGEVAVYLDGTQHAADGRF